MWQAWRKSNPDCRQKRRQRVKICDTLPSTNTHGTPQRQYQSRFAGAGGAGGRREPPLQKNTVTFVTTPSTNTQGAGGAGGRREPPLQKAASVAQKSLSDDDLFFGEAQFILFFTSGKKEQYRQWADPSGEHKKCNKQFTRHFPIHCSCAGTQAGRTQC